MKRFDEIRATILLYAGLAAVLGLPIWILIALLLRAAGQ